MEIKDVLKLKNVFVIDEELDWKAAIHKAVDPLVKDGSVEERYIDGIIENTEKLGPYYVLTEDVALLHARPDQGVIENQLAVLVNKKAVSFSDDGKHDARLMITLAAKDGEEHIKVIQALATLLSDRKNIDMIIDSINAEDIYALMVK